MRYDALRPDTAGFALLIRGFGVRVPGGAQLIKALSWCYTPDWSHFHVHCGQMCDPGVLFSFRIVILSRCIAQIPQRSVMMAMGGLLGGGPAGSTITGRPTHMGLSHRCYRATVAWWSCRVCPGVRVVRCRLLGRWRRPPPGLNLVGSTRWASSYPSVASSGEISGP
jgi:hypothetical protein